MTYSCTACGAPIEIQNRFSKVAVCVYCGTHHKVTVDGLDGTGKHPKLAEFPSVFSVGAKGTILGKPFTAYGRIRYAYDGGYFDEWFLDYDGEMSWLTEDEGTYTLYTDLLESVEIPEDIKTLHAGQNITIGDKRVMVKEKGTATVVGGEGELYHYDEPGTKIEYIDAIAEGKKLSIELSENEIEVFTGRMLLKRDILVGA